MCISHIHLFFIVMYSKNTNHDHHYYHNHDCIAIILINFIPIKSHRYNPIRLIQSNPIQSDPIQSDRFNSIEPNQIKSNQIDPIQSNPIDSIESNQIDPIQFNPVDPIRYQRRLMTLFVRNQSFIHFHPWNQVTHYPHKSEGFQIVDLFDQKFIVLVTLSLNSNPWLLILCITSRNGGSLVLLIVWSVIRIHRHFISNRISCIPHKSNVILWCFPLWQ